MKNIRVKPISGDVAIVYYLMKAEWYWASGKPMPRVNVAAAATYVKRNGNWYATFYQETVLDK